MKDDERDLLIIAGGGAALYIWWRAQQEGETPVQWLSSQLGGGLPGLDLSNLIGGINLGGLGGLQDLLGQDRNAVEEYIRSICQGGTCPLPEGEDASKQPISDERTGGGREPTVDGGGITEGATDVLTALGNLHPAAQVAIATGAGALGISTGYMAARTAPALARLSMSAVRGIESVAGGMSRLGGHVSQSLARRLVVQQTARAAARRTILQAGPKVTVGGMARGFGAMAVIASLAASAATIAGRLLFGEQAPEKVTGWGLLSSLSLSEMMYPSKVGAMEAGMGAIGPARRSNLAIGSGAEYAEVLAGRQRALAKVGTGAEFAEVLAGRQRALAKVGTGAEYAEVLRGREEWKREKASSVSGGQSAAQKEYLSALPF